METNLFSRFFFFFFFFCFSPDSSSTSFPGTLSFINHYFRLYRYLWEVVVNLFELLFDVHPGPRPVPALQLEPPPDRRCVHFVQWRPCRVLCCFEQGAGAGTKAGPEALYGRLENMSGHRTTSCCCCSCGCKCLIIFCWEFVIPRTQSCPSTAGGEQSQTVSRTFQTGGSPSSPGGWTSF